MAPKMRLSGDVNMHPVTVDMMIANQDYEDNKGSSESAYFWDLFVDAREAWRKAGKPS